MKIFTTRAEGKRPPVRELVILLTYVVLGLATAAYLPGAGESRSANFITTGGLLGLIVYLTQYCGGWLRAKKGIVGSYFYLAIFYCALSGLLIFLESGLSYTSIGNALALGLLIPIILLTLASPVLFLEKFILFVKNKKYRTLLENRSKLKNRLSLKHFYSKIRKNKTTELAGRGKGQGKNMEKNKKSR